MRKWICGLIALALVLALAVPALAEKETLYVQKDETKGYAEASLDAHVVRKFDKGFRIQVEERTEDGKWVSALVENQNEEGKTLIWFRAEDLGREKPAEECTHQWGEWETTAEASCTAEGSRRRVCALCGVEETETIDKLAHSFGEWETTAEPSCTAEGSRHRVCASCGAEETETIEKLAHTFGDWETTSEPSCTAEGERRHACTVCGFEETETVDKLPHSFGEWDVLTEATCTAEGERKHACTVCGFEETVTVDKLPHSFGDWILLNAATCTEPGRRSHLCSVCDYEEIEQIPVQPHDYQWKILTEATDHSAGVRQQVCRQCGRTEEKVSYDPDGTLRRGDRGEAVWRLQQLLADQNYLNDNGVDGIFGGGTEKALMKFQKDQGLNADGVAWPQTLRRLNHNFGPWQVIAPVTRAESGQRVRVCRDCGYEQHETIALGTTYERGRRGDDIRCLQQMLYAVGCDAGAYDGIYGGKLDAAFTAFAQAHGTQFNAGRVRPIDVDALMNAWIASLDPAVVMGEGTIDSPVCLALSVTPVAVDSGNGDIITYNWNLTNMGSESCNVNGLLLQYGSAADFRANNLVMVLDGTELRPNCANSVSGSFKVSGAWGEGNLNFAALAVQQQTGATWLSNTVTYAHDGSTSAAKTVAPIALALNPNALPDGVYPVTFDRRDIAQSVSGVFMNAVHVYTEDRYNASDIDTLAVGDTLIAMGETMVVESIDRSDYVIVNGGEDNGGCALIRHEGEQTYSIAGMDDMPWYTEVGVTSLMLDPAAVFVDAWDAPWAEPTTYAFDGIVDAIMASENADFDATSTTVRIANGRVAEIHRNYVP